MCHSAGHIPVSHRGKFQHHGQRQLWAPFPLAANLCIPPRTSNILTFIDDYTSYRKKRCVRESGVSIGGRHLQEMRARVNRSGRGERDAAFFWMKLLPIHPSLSVLAASDIPAPDWSSLPFTDVRQALLWTSPALEGPFCLLQALRSDWKRRDARGDQWEIGGSLMRTGAQGLHLFKVVQHRLIFSIWLGFGQSRKQICWPLAKDGLVSKR